MTDAEAREAEVYAASRIVREACDEWKKGVWPQGWLGDKHYARRILALPPAVPESEPVAWQAKSKTGGEWFDCSSDYAAKFYGGDEKYEVRPLFTHPPVESEPRREAHETRWSLLAARVTLKQLSDDPLQRQFADAILRQMASVEEELPVPVESEGAREAGMRKILEEGLADIDQHKLKVRSALYGDVEFWKLRKVVEAALTSTPEADIAAGRVERFDSMSEAIAGLHSPAGKEGFWCPHCGFVRADEDGCCAACGADCEVVEASPAVTERGEPEK